jgi:isoleucyl-tRNA synthetase
VYLADYATADDGTGIVHSSPAYGVDDFNSCVAHGIAYDDILNPVQGNGSYAPDFALFGGLNIWKAVPQIIETLRNAGRLFATHDITHSYPHCWRHKTPVIYRAAAQWFIRMDEGEGVFTKDKAPKTLRQTGAGRDRADQLLPRERQVPPARHDRRPARLVHQPPAQLGRAAAVLPAQGQGELHPRTPEILDLAADMVQPAASRPGARPRPKILAKIGCACRCPQYTKSSDILEVWFDSGTTHTTCSRARTPAAAMTTGPEADLYLEGHDQHRGWFHSSLLTACAMYDRAPYKAC